MYQNANGIPAGAQKMVRAAARQTGLSVREWLNSVIIDAAAEEGVPPVRCVFKDRDETAKPSRVELASLYSRLDDIAKKIEQLARIDINSAVYQEAAAEEEPIHINQLTGTLERLADFLQKLGTEQPAR